MSLRNNNGTRLAGRATSAMLAMVAGVAVSGCEDYLERRDTITLGAGDSIAINKATQTLSRWPAAAREDRWLSDGERARITQSRYRARAVPSPKTLENSGGESEILSNGGASQTGAGQ